MGPYRFALLVLLLWPALATAQSANPLAPQVDRLTQEITPQVVTWRRDFHQHPELGNRETRTAKVIAPSDSV